MLKDKLKVVTFALTALFLVGCNEIITKPENNDELILNGVVSELENNVNSVVNDALREDGSINQATLDDVMYYIAQDLFGDYLDLQDPLEKLTSETDAEFEAREEARLTFIEKVDTRINQKLYDLITSGQFETRSLFSERRFALSIESKLFSLVRSEDDPWKGENEDIVFPPKSSDPSDIEAVLDLAIHKDYYVNFINKNLIRVIYRELLVEQYLLTEDYASLGRTYARKVNYIGLKVSTENSEAVKYLMDTFVDEYILQPGAEPADLELLARAWRGVNEDGEIFTPADPEFELLESAGLLNFGEDETYDEGDTYKTLYGEILKRYEKIDPLNPLLTDTAVESEFTGNGQYEPSIGLTIKERELAKRDFTTDGWHIKNGGLGSLPSVIRDRVFNIGVANNVDRIDDEMVNPDGNKSDFLRKINGVSYLIPQISQPGDNRNFLLYDSTTQTYYLVQVLEAVNTTKMNSSGESTTNYDAIEALKNGTERNDTKRMDIAGEIARILGVRESNIKASTLHWLREADLQFHDQDIYDFFKERYPDLYDPEND